LHLAEIAAKVTEVLADIILTAPPDDQATLMGGILANLGSFCLKRKKMPIQLILICAAQGTNTCLPSHLKQGKRP
jgi:hypothetical protein